MGFHLKAGRSLIEDVIPPVESELLSFLVAHLTQHTNYFVATVHTHTTNNNNNNNQ